MAYDDRTDRRLWGRETRWRGDDSFGGGWGNQTPRTLQPGDDPYAGFYGEAGRFGSAARDFEIRRHDPNYAEWRRREIDSLDRDYEEYRRENQSRFDREFGAWRETRGRQREALARVRDHMEVVGSDGVHVGTVDCTRDDTIILTKSDAAGGGVHHRIPCAWVQGVGDNVILNLKAEEAMQRWREEGRSRALFEREDSGRDGPHILNRSFAGTYSDRE